MLSSNVHLWTCRSRIYNIVAIASMAAGHDPTGRELAGESSRDTMLPKPPLITLPSRQFCGLLISLFGLLLMGGSARPDVQSLAVLNPFPILWCAGGLLLLKREELKDKRVSFLGFFVVFLLIAAYLIPWTGRSGTSLLSSAHSAQGTMIDKDPAQAIAVAPATAWQSLPTAPLPITQAMRKPGLCLPSNSPQ